VKSGAGVEKFLEFLQSRRENTRTVQSPHAIVASATPAG
jgi:hypothetical protein